jgi:hypothetical protein
MRIPFPHVAVAATILACRAATVHGGDATDSSETLGRASRVREEPSCRNVPDFRCDAKWSRDGGQTAIVEHDIGAYRFCYHSLELESKEPIEIEDRKEWDELNEWSLDIGGIQLHVRQDSERANMEAHGWRSGEIERVWYPEASGRSARRVTGNTIRRETNVIFTNSTDARAIHFSYETTKDPWAVDELIDRVHGPWHRDGVSCDAGT